MIIFIVVGAIFLLALFGAGFVSASPREIKVISGWRKQRVLHGRTGWKVPILERVDTMTAEMISIDAKTTDFVTTKDFIEVKVDAAIKVRIGVQGRAMARGIKQAEAVEVVEPVEVVAK